MVVAESLINGTPVFGFKAGGPESISIEQYSFFVDYGDINSLIGKMKDYDYNSVDKNTIRIIARKKFSMDTIAKQYKNLYFDLLSKK
jgi:glycosyltransferase involved in cell wall biosynthesis